MFTRVLLGTDEVAQTMMPSWKLRADEGFSVAELLIASMILFFVLTAVVGLVGASTNMSVQAKNKALVTNAVATYIDEIRGYSWEDISSTDTGDPGGPDGIYVMPTVTRTISGVPVTISTTIEVKALNGEEYLKILRMNASAIVNGVSETYATRISIRNPAVSITLAGGAGAPRIEFDPSTPPENSVVYDDQVYWPTPGGLIIKTRASSPSGGITEVSYHLGGLDGTYLRNQRDPSGAQALFQIDPAASPVTNQSYWFTNQTYSVEGFQKIAVAAKDQQGRVATAYRTYIVDNLPAQNAPSAVMLSANGVRSLVATWSAARDGGTDARPCYANYYPWTLLRQQKTGSSDINTWTTVRSETKSAGDNPAAAIRNGGSQTVTFTAGSEMLPFARYALKVGAAGPRGYESPSAAMSAPVMTIPEVFTVDSPYPYTRTSTATLNKLLFGTKEYYYDVTMYVSRPNFPVGSEAYTSIWKSTDMVTWTQLLLSPPPSQVLTDTAAAKVTFTYKTGQTNAVKIVPLYFRVGVTVTPDSGAPVTLLTNAVGPAPIPPTPVTVNLRSQ